MAIDQSKPAEDLAADPAATLLTEQEAADRMRWSKQKIKRLRLSGKLPYYPGKPPMIELSDLEKLKLGALRPSIEEPAFIPPKDKMAEARERAVWLHFKLRQKATRRG